MGNDMGNDMVIQPHTQDQNQHPESRPEKSYDSGTGSHEIDGLKDKKPEDLTPEELRLMADTMPGDGPGDGPGD